MDFKEIINRMSSKDDTDATNHSITLSSIVKQLKSNPNSDINILMKCTDSIYDEVVSISDEICKVHTSEYMDKLTPEQRSKTTDSARWVDYIDGIYVQCDMVKHEEHIDTIFSLPKVDSIFIPRVNFEYTAETSESLKDKMLLSEDFIRNNKLQMAEILTDLSDEFDELYGASTVLSYYHNVIKALDFMLDSSIEDIKELMLEVQRILSDGFSVEDDIEPITISRMSILESSNFLTMDIAIDWLCNTLKNNQSVKDIVVVTIIAVNKILINDSLGIIYVPEELTVKLHSLVLDLFETGDSSLLNDFIKTNCVKY